MENSGPAYEQLLERTREALPDVASQVEEEVARGRRVTADTLAEDDRDTRGARMKSAGSRISKEDLIWLPYSDDQRLRLLLKAVLLSVSTAATSRAAVAAMLARNERSTNVRFVAEESPAPASEVDVGREAPVAAAALQSVRFPLQEGLDDLK